MQQIQNTCNKLQTQDLIKRLEEIYKTNTLRFDPSLHNSSTFDQQKTEILQLIKDYLEDIKTNKESIEKTEKLAPQYHEEVQLSDIRLTTTINRLNDLEKTIKKSEKSYENRFVSITSADSFEYKLTAVNRNSETYPQLLTISTNSNLVNLEKNAKTLKDKAMELYTHKQKNRSDIESK